MTGASHHHRPALAISLIVAGFTCFSTMDMLVKQAGETLPIEQITFARYAVHFAALLTVAPLLGVKALFGGKRLGFLALRGGFLFLSTILFFTAITQLPLAEAAAITFLAPILTVGLSVLFLKEVVGIRRWSAVAFGFTGILVILRPGLQELAPAHFMVLATAFFFAVFTLMTRHAGTQTPVVATTFLTALTGIVGSTFLLPGSGDLPGPADWPLLAVIGLLALAAECLLIAGYRYAAASLLAPFQYVQMLWATFFGWLVFSTLPDLWTCIGAVMVIGAGLYIWLRESRIRPPLAAAAGASGPK
ncbi:DMT family transporter [Nisaea acidiphila]|uniref:DMT family transporter n=1 Tax=Nisaea acidiphila TaxID=1862145 RepID=A0A9J7ARA4_9PROT|nr:DMT family transporter [Nisaea acidiphila]UUX49734.1 DMT family transporter [Nisaea acidiphila]